MILRGFLTIFCAFAFVMKHGWAADICSRTAIINYQEVIVDTNSNQKGEGLRYHLEKDPIAKSYLDTYQEGTKLKWQNAVPGTLGTILILSGILSNSSGSSRRTLLVGGASLVSVNFLISKTLEYNNETNLLKAVEEYNKRNIPHIYFNPLPGRDDSHSFNESAPSGFFISLSRSF